MSRPRPRRAFTLIEMVVSLTLTGVVLALVSAISLRQQRIVADLAEQRAVSERLREAAVLLPIQLRSASPSDLREALDTALELRATIAMAFVCDTAASELVLAPGGDDAMMLSPIEAGDSAWVLATSDTSEWLGARITAVASRAPAPCNSLGPILSDAALHAARIALSLSPMPPTPLGMPVRVTRPMRYSLYRAADGDWYVGEREWNNLLARFNSIQPIVGPFLKASAGGLLFRYSDSTDALLSTPVLDPRGVSLIELQLRAETRSATRVLSSSAAAGKRFDSTLLTVALRVRR